MKGITVAGSIVCDKLKVIERYPKKGMLANILQLGQSMGGIVPNTGISLKRFDPALPVYAMGCIGKDQDGSFAMDFMEKNGLDVSDIIIKEETATSFTDVITEEGGERTFFHFSGANAEYGLDELFLKEIRTELFHIGYLLMMAKLDEEDEEFGTKLARGLKMIREKGHRTSIDVVSREGADFAKAVLAALPYTDYLIINEIEAGNAVGIPARDEEGALIEENMEKILCALFAKGLHELGCIHCPEGGFAMDKNGHFEKRKSLKLPEGYIKGTVGAGDAFCAGMLYGIEKGWELTRSLDFANAAAACCLSEVGATEGMRSEALTWELFEKLSD